MFNPILYKLKLMWITNNVIFKIKKFVNNLYNLIYLILQFIYKIIRNLFKININKHGYTMSNLKLGFTIIIPCLLILLFGYIAYGLLHPNTNNPQFYNNNLQPISSNNYTNNNIRIQLKPVSLDKLSKEELSYIPNNTNTSIIKSISTPVIKNYITGNGNSVTTIPTYNIPTPKPLLTGKVNNQLTDNFNYLQCNGLNTDYKITPYKSYKVNENINLNMNIQNLKDTKLDSLTATITINSYSVNKADNQPNINYITQQTLFSDKNLNLEKTDIYNKQTSFKIPSYTPKGQYLILVNINGDNSANIKIQEIINIV